MSSPTLFDGVQAQAAYDLGVRRSDAARKRGASDRYGFNPSDEHRRHTDGMAAMAECYVAHTLNRWWISTGDVPDDPKAGDIEGGIGVRWTAHRHGKLILHPDDPDDQPMVLVTGEAWPLRIVGWVYGHEGKKPEYWRSEWSRPCYLVQPWRSIALLVRS